MRKPLKIALILGLSLAVLTATGLGVVVVKPQVAVGALQTALYRDGAEINPKHPLHPPQERVRDNGILYRNDIRFGDTFPNSFLDISYATADKTVPRPTIIYWHGGGFFGGDKAMGDPMAASDDSNKLFDELILEGYNLVNINYVLVPDHHFPDPVLQMNEAVNYLVAHAEELHLDMDDVILFGASAGAVMVSQYGAILSNPEYRRLYPLTEEPRLPLRAVRAMVVDDAPLVPENFDGLRIRLLMANYLDDSVLFPDEKLSRQYNQIPFMTAAYPRTILTAGTDDGFPADMRLAAQQLQQHGVEGYYFHTDEATYGKTRHGHMSALDRDNGAARAAFGHVVAFIGRR